MSSTTWVRQHLIDPEECARCGGCEDVCPKTAISHTHFAYAINPDLCDNCDTCLPQCQTGAISSWRFVPADAPYAVGEQLQWEELPAQDPAYDGTAGDQPVAKPVHAPRSAPQPVTHLFSQHAPLTGRIVANRPVARGGSGDVHHIVIETPVGRFPLLEGQSVGVVPPGTDTNGQPHHMRLYSAASARDGETAGTPSFALTVKRVIEDYDGQPVRGVCSNFLCDLAVGQEVPLVGPFGESFLHPDDGAPLIMIATGVGIAPMRGLIQRRARMGTSMAADTLFYGGRTRDQMAYLGEFESLAGQTGLSLAVARSREPEVPRRYVTEAISQAMDRLLPLLTQGNAHVYVCGVRALHTDLLNALANGCKAAGHDWDALHERLQAEGRFHVETF